MGQNISITNHNGLLKLKRNKRRGSKKASSSVGNDVSATSSTISSLQKSKAEESYQSSSIIIHDHEYIFPKAVSATSLDLRDLPYDTLKSEDDRMNAVCFWFIGIFAGLLILCIHLVTRINLHSKHCLAGKYLLTSSFTTLFLSIIQNSKKKNVYRNYLEEVGKHIDFESTHTKVLDIGCGAGGWVMVCALVHSFYDIN